jgi:uncharacterized protein (DUF849 family)
VTEGLPGTAITVAPTGAETAPADAPGLPVTPAGLAATARSCADAGAAAIHVHVRDAAGTSTLDLGRLTEALAAVRGASDLVVQLSTGGAVGDSEAERLRVLEAAPDAASCMMGTVNFGDDVFVNRWPFIVELHTRMRDARIVPSYECFDLGHVQALHRLLDRHGDPFGGHVHVDLVLGVAGGMPGTAAALLAAVQALPAGCSWSATGVGRAHLPVLLGALAAGGHLRVGMEDVLSFAPGEPVRDNAQLVARAATFATLAQRPPLSPTALRTLLGIPVRAAA